ncbi:MAG: hypothetical protein Q9194_006959 [Teloschistes cf. exilis]
MPSPALARAFLSAHAPALSSPESSTEAAIKPSNDRRPTHQPSEPSPYAEDQTSDTPSQPPTDKISRTPALEPGELVLVTGVNGYIGSHIAYELLKRGYMVRGTVRDASKGEYMRRCFAEMGLLGESEVEKSVEGGTVIGHERSGSEEVQGKKRREGEGGHENSEIDQDRKSVQGEGHEVFEIVVVKDMAAENAFDDVVEGCSAIIHVATDLSLNHNPHAVIPPMIFGVQNALRAAARSPSVKRFIYTSSCAACTAPIANKAFHVTDQTWNEADIALAWAPPPYAEERRLAVYAASKTLAEKECWRFVKEEKPGFVLNAVLPNCNIGRILCREQPASTGGWYKHLWDSNDAAMLHLLREEFPPQHWVNVTDTAVLHVAALLEGDVRGERILAFAGPFNWNDTVDVLERIDGEDGNEGWREVVEGVNGVGGEVEKGEKGVDGWGKGKRTWERKIDCPRDLKTVETGRAEELLRRGWNVFDDDDVVEFVSDVTLWGKRHVDISMDGDLPEPKRYGQDNPLASSSFNELAIADTGRLGYER